MKRDLLVTDVDGTLLGRDGRFAMHADELARVRPGLSVVLASSRTLAELAGIQNALGLQEPIIAENGAVVAFPWQEELQGVGACEVLLDRAWCVVTVGEPRAGLLEFVECGVAETGARVEEQERVQPGLGRRASVALRPARGASPDTLAPLAAWLRVQDCAAAFGGDWLAVTRGADKGAGVRTLLRVLPLTWRSADRVVAVGDGENDLPLLRAVPERYVVRRPNGSVHPMLAAVPDAIVLDPPGVDGWRTLVGALTRTEES